MAAFMRLFCAALPALLLAACNLSPSPNETTLLSGTDSTQKAEALQRAGVVRCQ